MVSLVLTISKLKRWSINYYVDTAATAARVTRDAGSAGGGLGEYYTEHETRNPVWLCAGDSHTAAGLVGLGDVERAGGTADSGVVALWLDTGVAPNGLCGRGFGARSVHGFDLTFCAPKSVSLLRVLRGDDVVQKAIACAHATAIGEAMEYLAQHAGYTRVHNPVTDEKDLVRLPGLVGVGYQHETSRRGDPHLHTHVIVPNRQARADGVLVSIDGTSLFHEAKAAGVIYQATLRRELHRSVGFEWKQVDPSTGMAEVAGVTRDCIAAWSRRSSQLRDWAAGHLAAGEDGAWSAEQLAAAQKATRPTKPEELAWTTLLQQWRADPRGLILDRAGFLAARAARRAAADVPWDRARISAAAEHIEKATFTRADLVEVLGAQIPVDSEVSPREMVETAVDAVSVRLTAPRARARHEREGHERFTLEAILAEERAVLELVDAHNDRARLWIRDEDTAALSADQRAAVEAIGASPWLVQPLTAPAGAGKTTCLRALAAAARRRFGGATIVLAPTGKAVDVALREGAGDRGYTIAKALQLLQGNQFEVGPATLIVVDEAAMVGTADLKFLLTATTAAGAKTVLIGDAHQLGPVNARGGMFAQLCGDLPWTQKLSEVWRMREPDERAASLALRDGGPAPVRRAVDWYRQHDRLRCGDEVFMAADAVIAYQADIAAGRDALLVCDTRDMADALNCRIHNETIVADAPTVRAARGQQIAAGDVILTCRNDAAIPLRTNMFQTGEIGPVRNGQRWQVQAVSPDNGRLIACRLADNTLAAFPVDYVRAHVTYGYAVTVHAAQGVTADTTHAVLGATASRALAYVAMTRGRASNTAYLYERRPEQLGARSVAATAGVEMGRGSSRHAVLLLRTILGNDSRPTTAYTLAATAGSTSPVVHVRDMVDHHTRAVQHRAAQYRHWHAEIARNKTQHRLCSRDMSLERSRGVELEL